MTLKPLLALSALSLVTLAPLAASAQTNTYSTATGGAIPDGDAGGISSTINVADRFDVGDLSYVTVRGFLHTWVGDLIVTISHNGKTVDILDRVIGNRDGAFGDDSDLFGNYTFVSRGGADFNAAAAAVDGISAIPTNVNYATLPVGCTNPDGGVSSANGQLSDFAGFAAAGAWTLNISDRASGNTGSFSGWNFGLTDRSYINANTTIGDTSYLTTPVLRVGAQVNADLTLAEGGRINQVQIFSGSRLFMNGGLATAVTAISNGSLHIAAGTILGAVTATESSTAYISGGKSGSVVTGDGARAYVLAGTFGSVSASGNSGIFVYGGGTAGGAIFAAAGGASISLFGDNLAMNAGTKTRGDFGGNLGYFYNLSGTLTDGTSLAGSRFFDADGGLSVVGENPGALYFNGVAVVPEPGSLPLMLGAGCWALGIIIKRRRK